MPVAWPTSVPQSQLARTFKMRFAEQAAKFEPEIGPPKLRRRTSMTHELHSYDANFSEAEWDALMRWWRDTLKEGTVEFTRAHPRTGAAIVCQFVTAPTDDDLVPGYVRSTISYRVIALA